MFRKIFRGGAANADETKEAEPAIFPDDDDALEVEGQDLAALAAGNIPRVLVLGKTGAGKSSLLNSIIGATGRGKKKLFKTSRRSGSETKEVTVKLRRFRGPYNVCGDGEPPKVIVVDAPGFMDSDGDDSKIMEDIVAKSKQLRHLNLFLLVVNGEEARLGDDFKQMLRQLVGSCSVDVLRNAFVVFTRWGLDKASKRRRLRELEDEFDGDGQEIMDDQMLKDERRRDLINVCQEEFGLGADLNFECAFVDNLFDEEEPDQVAETRIQFNHLKTKIFFQSMAVQTSGFKSVKSAQDQLRDAAANARQQQDQAQQDAREAQAARDDALLQAEEDRKVADDARKEVAALTSFIGIKVSVGSTLYNCPRVERRFQESSSIQDIKQWLCEKGISMDKANLLVLMRNGSALSSTNTLGYYNMRANTDYQLIGIVEQHGGMNRDVAKFLQQVGKKDITYYYEPMAAIPQTRMCPKCNILVKHITACKHLTCKWCRHEFCFACLRDWQECYKACGRKACYVAPRQA